MNNKSRSSFLALIHSFFITILGQLSWSAPSWLVYIKRKAAEKPRVFWGRSSILLVVLLLVFYGYHWYTHLPRQPRVTALITAPHMTPVAKVLVPDVLTIDFGIKNNEFASKSVAPLKLIGKEIPDGITLSPVMPGKWVWQTDSRLVFTPANDWPAGQDYTLHFSKPVFTKGIKMESLDYSFSTLPFAAQIAEFKFYQDPVNPDMRQAVATIQFNYPVDSNSFEQNTTLMLQKLKDTVLNLSAEHFKFTVTYDEHKRTAYLRSESLPMPQVPRYLILTIDKDVKPLSGPSATTEAVSKNVYVPDAASYFKVTNATSAVVRNDQDRPEQVFTIETTLGVTDAELNNGLHVYLLPKDYPATATEEAKTNYQWQNPGEVSADILKLATPLELHAIPSDHDFATLHSYKFSAQTPSYIYLKIDSGIHGFGHFTLADPYAAVIKVPDYPKEISFLHKGALLALSGEKKLSVLIRGVPAVKFQFARVLLNNVNQLITQTQGNFNDPQFLNLSFNQDNISDIFSEVRTFDQNNLAKEQYTALDFGTYLSQKTNTSGPQGLFLLTATGWDTKKNVALDVKSSRLILVTDLGLVTKDNNDGSHDIYVQSITQGAPVANANVAILGKNGLPILTRMTDAQGHAHFPTLKDFTNEREPTVYLANLLSDVSFIPYNNTDRQLNFSRFDIGGTYTNDDLQTLSAYVFSDRGIYRPGDTAHIGMIVKQAYVQPQPAGLPLDATITDPRGTTVQEQKFTLDATGYLTLDFHTEDTSPTGQYTVNLYIVKDNKPSNLLGSTTIRVAEFQPDRMRIKSHLSTEQSIGWISPNALSANVELWNLYGAPATDRKVTAKILLAPKRVQFNAYPSYIFVDPLFDPNKPAKVFTDTLTDSRTDAKGQAQFDLNLERFEKSTYQLTFFAEGFEAEGGRSVATQTSALISPLSFFVGYKADGDLNYIKQNSQHTVNFIVVNPQLKQQAVNNLKIQLAALHPVSTLVKNPDGTFQYKSLIQTSVISTQDFSVNENSTNYTLPTQQIGDFAVTVLDQNNTELSRFKYTVVGASQLPLTKNAELSVKLNKSAFHAGEDIEMEITAPYTGAGLITIERDKVYATQWFKTNTTSSVQKIHIPNDFQGNGYVNVAFVRDWDSPEIFISPLSYSVVPFSVDHSDRAIHIDLTTPELARPGEPFTIQYKSDKPGKIIVFAVDEGILQVASYKTPDPLSFFFQKHALEVVTQQTVDQILPKFIQDRELSAVGGDGGEAALRSHLNPFKRKTDLPVVYWSGIIDTDTTTRQLIYQVPDYFNGTLHVMAVAVAADAVGAADKTSEVRGQFVINPNVPTFTAPGDEFEITASIANNVKGSGVDAKVNVHLNVTPELELIDPADQTIAISEGQEKTVTYKLRAKSTLGSARIDFTANIADKSSKMSATLSVRPASSYFTTINSGRADTNKTLTLDRNLYPEYRRVEAAVSSSPLILIAGLQRYLDNFPYGCTEQLVSKAFPLVAVANQPWFFVNHAELAQNKIQNTIQALGQRQMSSGAFSYWPTVGQNDSDAFSSVYAMHFLTEARAAGYPVPNDILRAGISYLKDLASQTPTDLDQARIQAYAIYILTRNEIVTTNYLTNLQLYLDQDKTHVWHQDILSVYIAATYQLLKSDRDAERMIDYFKPADLSENAVTDFYSNDIARAQYLYLLAKHFPDRLNKLGDDLVMPLVTAGNSDEINTILSSYISLALSAYAQTHETTHHAALSISETLQNGQQKILVTPDSVYQKAQVDELAHTIDFITPEKQAFFYQVTQTGFDKNLSNEVLKNNLEIEREYRDEKGNVLASTTLGKEIEVRIQVRSLNNTDLSHVAIVDLLPGGFEVVRDSVKSDNVDYADIREDRVIFFSYVTPDSKEIVYRIKATNAGKFIVPPISATSMYNPNVNAHNAVGLMTVTN